LDGFYMPIKVPLPELYVFFGGVVRRGKLKLAQLHPRLDFDLHHSHRVLENKLHGAMETTWKSNYAVITGVQFNGLYASVSVACVSSEQQAAILLATEKEE
jgi:hypothetical protein